MPDGVDLFPGQGSTGVMATWIIRSKTSPSRRRKIFFPCLQTQVGRCTITSRQQLTHARTTIFSRDAVASFMAGVFTSLLRLKDGCLDALSSRFARWTKPLTSSLPLQTLADLGRSKSELVAENALLRQQLIILKRQVERPACTKRYSHWRWWIIRSAPAHSFQAGFTFIRLYR